MAYVCLLPGFASNPYEPGVAQAFIDALIEMGYPAYYLNSRRNIVIKDVADYTQLVDAQVSAAYNQLLSIAEEEPEILTCDLILVGHSLGCLYAAALADKLPNVRRLVLLSPAALYWQRRVDLGRGLVGKTIHSWKSGGEPRRLAVQQAKETFSYVGFGPARFKLMRTEILAARSELLPYYLSLLFEPDDKRRTPMHEDFEIWAMFPQADPMFRPEDVLTMINKLEWEYGIVINQLPLPDYVGHDVLFWLPELTHALAANVLV